MDLLRELIRDLIGIIFPGSILLLLILGGAWTISFFIRPEFVADNPLNYLENTASFFFFVAVAYIAGQYLRLKTMTAIENDATNTYRKERQERFKERYKGEELDFEQQKARLEALSEAYFQEKGQLETLQDAKGNIQEMSRYLRKWEHFPYPFEMLRRRILFKPFHYNRFFRVFEKNGKIKDEHDHHFINFCKVVVFKFNPDLKDEILRKESLIRLMAGMYYVTKFGRYLSFALGGAFLIFGLYGIFFSVPGRYQPLLQATPLVMLILVLILGASSMLRREIIGKDSLRTMRQAEVELIFDCFYTVCTTEANLKDLNLPDSIKKS